MSGFTFRPAKREDTPLIIGIAGPTKSGKTYSALRLAMGLADGGVIAMLNTEGKRGEQYADSFSYMNCNMEKPFSPERYGEGVAAFKALKPAVGIIDSGTHLHDGPGGLLEYHEAELDRIAGKGADYKRRERCNYSAWIKPKAAENAMVYSMLELECPMIICFRAKEKLLIVTGKDPVNLGWQPIVSDRVAYETIFTLVLPPHSRGVPDLDISEMRDPFDKIVPRGKPIDEELGRRLAEWSRGHAATQKATPTTPKPPTGNVDTNSVMRAFMEEFQEALQPVLKGQAKVLIEIYLKEQGYKRDDGTTGLSLVPPELFEEFRKGAIAFAKQQ